jgi:hypothetical protein
LILPIRISIWVSLSLISHCWIHDIIKLLRRLWRLLRLGFFVEKNEVFKVS